MSNKKQIAAMKAAYNQPARKFEWVVAGRRAKDAFNAPLAKKARAKQSIQGKIDQFRQADSSVKIVGGVLVANVKK